MKRRIRTAVALLAALAMVMTMSVAAFADGVIGNKAALNKALKNTGLKKTQVKYIENEYDAEENVYEVEFTKKKNNAEYSFDIDAETGKILEKSVDYKYTKTKSKKKISKKSARKKAAKITGVKYSKVKKGTCKYKYKKKFGKYTVKFKTGGYKYEVDIAAATGKIIEYDKELIGR